MENNCSNCKYWDPENRFKNGEDGYCDHKSFLESVYTTNEDEPGIIVVKADFCCKFYKQKIFYKKVL